MCVGDVQYPKGAMTEVQEGPRERNICPYIVSEIISSDLDESQYIFGAKKADRWKIGIPGFNMKYTEFTLKCRYTEFTLKYTF